MRRIFREQSRPIPAGSRESKEYHEKSLEKHLVHRYFCDVTDLPLAYYSKVVQYSEGGSDRFIAEGDMDREVFAEILAVFDKVVERVHGEIVSELKRSQVHQQAEEFVDHFLDLESIKKRVVFDLGSKVAEEKQNTNGEYDVVNQRIILYCKNYIGDDGRFEVGKFVHTLVHEIVHSISYNEVDVGIYPGRPTASGYSRIPKEKYASQYDFIGLNEAVVDATAFDLTEKIYADLGFDEENAMLDVERLTEEEKEFYAYERTVLKTLVAYVAEYTGTTYDIVWNGMKRGLLEGLDIRDQEIAPLFEECFGEDVGKNFLSHLWEYNDDYAQEGRAEDESMQDYRMRAGVAVLKKRWEENGMKRLQEERGVGSEGDL